MKLSEILSGISDLKAKGNVDIDIANIAYDSRKVTPESLRSNSKRSSSYSSRKR